MEKFNILGDTHSFWELAEKVATTLMFVSSVCNSWLASLGMGAQGTARLRLSKCYKISLAAPTKTFE